MKIRFRLWISLPIATLAAGLVIGALLWSSLAPRTDGGARSEIDKVSPEGGAATLNGAEVGGRNEVALGLH